MVNNQDKGRGNKSIYKTKKVIGFKNEVNYGRFE